MLFTDGALTLIVGALLSTETKPLGPAPGAVLPARSLNVPDAMDIPRAPSPLIELRVTIRVLPEPLIETVQVAVPDVLRVISPGDRVTAPGFVSL